MDVRKFTQLSQLVLSLDPILTTHPLLVIDRSSGRVGTEHIFVEAQKDRRSDSVTRKIASVNLAYFRNYQRMSDRLHRRRFA